MSKGRRISGARLVRRHVLWLPAVLLLVGPGIAGRGLFEQGLARKFERDGVETVAIVTERGTHTQHRDGGRTRSFYRLQIVYSPLPGQQVTGQQVTVQRNVSPQLFARVQIGQEIPVRFLPDAPENVALEPLDPQRPQWMMMLGLGIAAGGLGLALLLGRRAAAMLRTANRGEIRTAEVAAHQRGMNMRNGRWLYRFAWRDTTGATGQSAEHDIAALPAPGSRVSIHIDPRTGRGWWREDLLR